MKKYNAILKILSLVLALAVLASAGPAAAWADDNVLTLRVGAVMADSNGDVHVPVMLYNANGLATISFALQYDSDMLEYQNDPDHPMSAVGYTVGALLNGHEVPEIASTTPGTIIFTFDDLKPVSGSGELVVFSFRAKNALLSAELKASLLYINNDEKLVFSDYNFNPVTNCKLDPGVVVVPDFVLPEYLTTIESEAFAGINEKLIYVPENVTSIAADAFDPEGVILIVKDGSSAMSAAQAQGYTHFIPVI